MNARHWVYIAAFVSAANLAGTADANDAAGARSNTEINVQSGASAPTGATPSTSFDAPSAMDRPPTPGVAPEAASRESNGAINGAVAGSVDRGARSTMTAPEKRDDATPGNGTSIVPDARELDRRSDRIAPHDATSIGTSAGK